MDVIEIGVKEVVILFVFLIVCRVIYVKIMTWLDHDKFLSKLPTLNKNLLRYGIQIQEQGKQFVFIGWHRTTGPMTISMAKTFMYYLGRNEQMVVDYFKENSSTITKSVDFFKETE
ncbi:hypothetical protein Aeh1ORF124c [Aeromonas phage Aeh1]|uniref:Uncharacterized protein n=1 Tax=Aeromonas phage Aeh1 TaxID=2880362 RepID=Q76YV9_9CAUD|nr:hypothetical protein Aeh1p132 [Aeromonas phage Aeh1]AAQ17787.1 hypothetical protein Aeh1ORF124c [Aeromonas phage Aeh1]